MPKNYRTVPIRKNAKLAIKRGILRYKIIKRSNELLRVAITKKFGPLGGKTLVVAKLKKLKIK